MTAAHDNTPTTDDVCTLDLGRVEKPVRLRDPDTGQVSEYLLIELDGTERDKYLNDTGARVDMRDGKVAGIRTFDKMQAYLISLHLHFVGIVGDPPSRPRPKDQRVPVETIQAWPSRVIENLFKQCQALSGLEKDADKTAKND